MTKKFFESVWSQFNKDQKKVTLSVVEQHMTTGKSLRAIVNTHYPKKSKDETEFKTALITMSNAYMKFKI